VNGQRIARGVIKEGEEIREIDVEAELPARARIGLAELIFLEFTAAEQTTAVIHPSATAGSADTSAATAAVAGAGANAAAAEPPPETGADAGAGTRIEAGTGAAR